MTRATVTPLEALKRLIPWAKQVDFKDCPDLYNQFQAELAVAEMVVRDYVEPVAVQPADPDDMAANYDHSTHDERMELLRGMQDEQTAVVAVPDAKECHRILKTMADKVDDWAYGLSYEPSKEELSKWCINYISSQLAAPAIAAPVEAERLPQCQCFTEQQEQYCILQRKCAGKAVAYAAIATGDKHE